MKVEDASSTFLRFVIFFRSRANLSSQYIGTVLGVPVANEVSNGVVEALFLSSLPKLMTKFVINLNALGNAYAFPRASDR